MKFHEKKEAEEYVEKIYKESFDFIDKLNQSLIDSYCIRYKYVENEIEDLSLNEPFKIFKNKYLNWLKEIEKLELEKQELLKKIGEIINNL